MRRWGGSSGLPADYRTVQGSHDRWDKNGCATPVTRDSQIFATKLAQAVVEFA